MQSFEFISVRDGHNLNMWRINIHRSWMRMKLMLFWDIIQLNNKFFFGFFCVCVGNGEKCGRTIVGPSSKHQIGVDSWCADSMSTQHLGCDAIFASGLGCCTSRHLSIACHHFHFIYRLCYYNTLFVGHFVSVFLFFWVCGENWERKNAMKNCN